MSFWLRISSCLFGLDTGYVDIPLLSTRHKWVVHHARVKLGDLATAKFNF